MGLSSPAGLTPAGPQGAREQGLRLPPTLGSESAELGLCSSLFFINELLEVPAESCSLRGWAGLPRVPILKLPSPPPPPDDCGNPPAITLGSVPAGVGRQSSWNVFSTGGGRHAQGLGRHLERKLRICSLAAGQGRGQLVTGEASVTFTETTFSSPYWSESESRSVESTLCSPMDCTDHGVLQSRILEWGSHSLLQGIFPAQGSNPGLPHCRWLLYQLSHKLERAPRPGLGGPGVGEGCLPLSQRVAIGLGEARQLQDAPEIPSWTQRLKSHFILTKDRAAQRGAQAPGPGQGASYRPGPWAHRPRELAGVQGAGWLGLDSHRTTPAPSRGRGAVGPGASVVSRGGAG